MFLISTTINGQDPKENILKHRIDSIQQLIYTEMLIVDKLNLRLEQAKADLINFSSQTSMNTQKSTPNNAGESGVCVMGTYVQKSVKGYDIICRIKTGDKAIIINKESGFYKIYFNGIYGYVMIESMQYEKILLAQQQARLKKQEQAKAEKIELERLQTEEIDNLVKKYGKRIGYKIYYKEVWLGATTKMMLDSWGHPISINRSVGSWGVHEQWVYDNNRYLYFKNGRLDSWQD